jgi:stalled ribosome rescue protein Dom34
MKKEIGLWVDHRQAVIVALTDSGEQITRIRSDAEKQIRFAGGSRKDGLQTTESIRGKKLDSRLAKYFDDILVHIRDAELIQIFGPGDAKNELAKHLEKEGLKERIVAVETTDNMTDNQISAKVREHFLVKN